MMHIKEPLLLIEKSSLCGSSGFPLSLSEWSFTICPTPHCCLFVLGLLFVFVVVVVVFVV